MRRLVGVSVLGAALALSPTVFAQTPQAPPQPPSGATDVASDEEVRAATTTASGTTGIWFVPTAEVLQARKWSVSLYRTNFDDGQGFTDISHFPVTFAVGLGGRAELFGNWAVITRIDRDARPLFFESTADAQDDGTGGGIVPNHPLNRTQWTGNKLGDLTVGGKVNLLGGSARPLGVGIRGMVKLPVGDEDSGASSGKTDVQVDAIVSGYNSIVEMSGYGGMIFRGSPDGYELTNGIRWGVGAAFPQTNSLGLRVHAELFGERYFDNQITAPSGQVGTDGSIVPTTTFIKSPAVLSLGLTWRASNGFFIGGGGTWNINMEGREDASCAIGFFCPQFSNEGGDKMGVQVRLGFHPGARNRTYVPREITPPPPPPPPPPPANRPPTVQASCNPCTVQIGQTSTITADAQDPDGDPLTYQWSAPAGTITSPTNRQSPWTAPQQEGPVPVTVTVNDGRGGTASSSVTIQVTRPAQRTYTFEDVHFDFDRYNLRPDALRILDEAITAMQADATLNLTIEGHTDNIGTSEYNLALGERRATSVREYLISRGIAAARVTTISYGEERPRYDNSREETRRRNRRAALVVRLQ